MRTRHTPAKMVNTQKTQRHDVPDTSIQPLTRGPMVGPAKGASVKTARALPLVSASHMSDITALMLL